MTLIVYHVMPVHYEQSATDGLAHREATGSEHMLFT